MGEREEMGERLVESRVLELEMQEQEMMLQELGTLEKV
jgi:hypothetical protein